MAPKRHNPRSFVEHTLAKWLEWEGGARAVNMEPGRAGWRGEPDSLLWNCTIGAKVEHTPKLPWDPDNPMSLMSVCEQVARLRMAETSLAGQEQQARRVADLLVNVKGQESVRAHAAGVADKLKAGRKWVDDRLGVLLTTPEYRLGMDYLSRELTRAWHRDSSAPAHIVAAIVEQSGPKDQGSVELLRMLMIADDMTALDLADMMGVSLDFVKKVMQGKKRVPKWWLDELAEWQTDVNEAAVELERRRLSRMAGPPEEGTSEQ